MTISQYFRPALCSNISTYIPTTRVSEKELSEKNILKLDSGENVWIPKTLLASEDLEESLALYPDSSTLALRQALSTDLGVSIDNLVVGNGSDELIDLLMRLFLEPNDAYVDFTPTFPMYSFFGALNGGVRVVVPRTGDFQIDVGAAKAAMADAKVAFLANPNNPTGTLIPRAAISELLELGTPLVVDEAYFEFCNESVVDLVSKYENLIVLRTFSKWAGLAGVRIGYMIANPAVIERINAIKPPYNVNSIAQVLAIQALAKKSQIMKTVNRLIDSRDWFIKACQKLPDIRVVPSQASCVTIFFQKKEVGTVVEALQSQGIIVKSLAAFELPTAIRISLAPQKNMRRVLRAIQEIL